ncbi:SCO family protein [Fulvivirga sp. M361]|uniref:SCO family protein n=1 Tax=Fulvivirga sp. M361 TaxID=2594266 RepID=UPI00117A07A4|nr:SCO family protein [Fulvivirga sp. M361]TRX60559.1 SCO family protein [Fulvivirga sp. M361]
MRTGLNVIMLSIVVLSCRDNPDSTLPILGEMTIDSVSGNIKYYQAPEFTYIDQRNRPITHEDFEGKVQVVDFFFTSCPTICPKMTRHLKTVQDYFINDPRVAIISFSIDPKHDTPERLKSYAENHGVNDMQWSLLTGNGPDVFALSKDYKVMAFDDRLGNEPNLIHDGTFVLVDDERKIRGYYNGLDKEDITRLIKDIEKLLS